MCCIAVFFSADRVELPTRVYRNFTGLVLRLSTFRKHFLLSNLARIHSKPSSTDHKLKIRGNASNIVIFRVWSENWRGKLVHNTSKTFFGGFLVCLHNFRCFKTSAHTKLPNISSDNICETKYEKIAFQRECTRLLKCQAS